MNDSDKILEDRNIWLFSSGPEENGGGEKLTMVVERPQLSTKLKFKASESSGVSALGSATGAGIVRRRELVANGKVCVSDMWQRDWTNYNKDVYEFKFLSLNVFFFFVYISCPVSMVYSDCWAERRRYGFMPCFRFHWTYPELN